MSKGLKSPERGVFSIAQRDQWHLCSTKTQVRSLALHRELKDLGVYSSWLNFFVLL